MKCLERRYREKVGEIDLIMEDGDCLVFVEVKSRFSSAEHLEKGSIVLVKLNIRVSEDKSVYGVLGKVLESRIIRNSLGLYEQSLEYQEISGKSRETIIRYIFEQERRLRKK